MRIGAGLCLVGEKSRFHSLAEGVGGFQRDTTAVMALPSMVTTTPLQVVSWPDSGPPVLRFHLFEVQGRSRWDGEGAHIHQ